MKLTLKLLVKLLTRKKTESKFEKEPIGRHFLRAAIISYFVASGLLLFFY